MAEYQFNPPLTLKGGGVVRTLDDVVAFMYTYKDAKRPILQAGILHRLEGADTEDQQRDAANAFLGFAEVESTAEERRVAAEYFRGWAQIEGLLLRP
jgi:hypothetical protein